MTPSGLMQNLWRFSAAPSKACSFPPEKQGKQTLSPGCPRNVAGRSRTCGGLESFHARKCCAHFSALALFTDSLPQTESGYKRKSDEKSDRSVRKNSPRSGQKNDQTPAAAPRVIVRSGPTIASQNRADLRELCSGARV